MNIKPLLKKAFEGMRCPVSPIDYEGKSDEYLIYFQYNETTDNASGKPYQEATYGQVTVYATYPPSDLVKDALARLRKNGFKASRGTEGKNAELGKYYAIIDLSYECEAKNES